MNPQALASESWTREKGAIDSESSTASIVSCPGLGFGAWHALVSFAHRPLSERA